MNMPRGKHIGYKQAKLMAKAANRGKSLSELAKRYGLNSDTISLHVRAINENKWPPNKESTVMPAMRRVRSYAKDPAIDPETKMRQDKEFKVMRQQAISLARDNEGLRKAYDSISREKLALQLHVNRLETRLEEALSKNSSNRELDY
jgi:transposase-like protein